MKCHAFRRSASIDRIRQRLCHKMAPNFKEAESPTEASSLLGGQNEYDDVEPDNNQKSSKRSAGPDGLRAWVVAFVNFLINFIVVGLGRMSGILYVAFMQMFHIDRKTASMPFSIQQAARNLFGPLAGILGQKYGVRAVTIAGGFIGTFSAMACFFVMDIKWITVLWGLIFGICTALTTTLNQVPIDQYFEKYRTTAGGLAFSGGCVAAFIFPVVLEYLIANYGIARTFLVMGTFIFFVIPASLILVEPPWHKKKEIPEELVRDDRKKRSPGLVAYNTFHSTTYKNAAKKERKPINFDFLRKHSEFVYQLFVLTIPDEVFATQSFSDTLWGFSDTIPLVNELEELYNYLKEPPSNKTESVPPREDLTHSVHVVEVTINGFPKQDSTDSVSYKYDSVSEATPTLPQSYKSYEDNPRWFFLATKLREVCESKEKALLLYFPSDMQIEIIKILELLRSLNDLRTESEVSSKNDLPKSPNSTPYQTDELSEYRRLKQAKEKAKRSNSFMVHIKTALKLHTNPLFLLICLCRAVFMLTFIPLITIIVDFAMDKGLQQSTGKYIIAILSLGDLLGRLCLGWINDVGCLSLPRYMLVVMMLLAISTATLPLMHSEVSLMPAVLIFGMLQGSLFIRHQVLVSKYMDSHEQAIGMGFINLLSGFIGFALPFYIGYFRDTQGSYDNMFYLNGAICALVGLMWLFEPLFVRFSSKKEKYEKVPEAT